MKRENRNVEAIAGLLIGCAMAWLSSAARAQDLTNAIDAVPPSSISILENAFAQERQGSLVWSREVDEVAGCGATLRLGSFHSTPRGRAHRLRVGPGSPDATDLTVVHGKAYH